MLWWDLERGLWWTWSSEGGTAQGADLVIHRLLPPEHQNFFGLDEVLGPVAVSLRREEKESSGGGTLHSYRIIVRTTQVGRGHGN